MKILNLITSKNVLLKTFLQNEGFIVHEFLQTGNGDNPDIETDGAENSYTLLEIPELNKAVIEKITETLKLLQDRSKLICFCETMSQDIRSFLLQNGLPHCITGFDPIRISLYIKHLDSTSGLGAGRFLILDDNTTHKNMLNAIIKRFGYETDFISTAEELFERIGEPGNAMLLINIGTEKLDLNGIVRKSYMNSDIKKIPVIAYKCMDQGLFVHEVINGLHRLTKVILSPEELYCMLTDMLFKKEIVEYTDFYVRSLKYEKFSTYTEKSIQQIYYEIQTDICGQESLFERERIESLIKSAENMRGCLIKIDGISWLRQVQTSQKRSICGAGV